MKRIAIFASGSGSNAEKIMEHFKDSNHIEVALVVTNNPKAFVLERAAKFSVPNLILEKGWQKNAEQLCDNLRDKKIDLIVLAGFMQLIPKTLVENFPDKIVNIHPALLPKYGGKGMYGMNVHKAVKDAGEKESGITIHFVNEKYDEGQIVFQAKCALSKEDSPEDIQTKVQVLEHQHFAPVVEGLLS